jgi:hypothetical protein
MRWKALAVGAAMMTAAAGCGAPDVGGSSRQSGRTYGTETWYEASFGASPTEVVVRFEGPQGAGDEPCAPDRDTLVEADGTEVKLTVKRYAPSPVVVCPVAPQTMSATLPGPLGDRPLVNPQTGWRFRADGDRLVVDPDSTPCARADCSAPAVAKASCNPLEYGAVIDEQLQARGAPDSDVRCDGSFLVLTRAGRRAWFVNREASWRLVTVDQRTCDDVWKAQRIRFPAALCR